MGSLTETAQREFSKRIVEIVNASSGQLQETGIDISAKSSALSAKVDEAFSAEQRQLRARADSEAATRVSQEATKSAYQAASDMVELLVGALGKNDAFSKRLRNVRDEIAKENSRGRRKEPAAIS